MLTDSAGKGVADTRQVFANGTIQRLDADTNDDRQPDVNQYFEGGQVSRQDEDSNFDGLIDRRFDGGQQADVPEGARIAGESFGKLGCGSFDRFWWKR